jgi:Tol biopolymer transport system component
MEVELPRWSPDGKQIAFMGKKPGMPWRIYLMSALGDVPKDASEGSDNQGAPTWSPDGKFLVYGNVLCQGERACAIRTINLATGKVEMLSHSQGLTTARWSPDGRHIAALDRERHELYVFDLNRQEWHRLAESTNGDDISWSADSQHLYTKRSRQNDSVILLIPVGGGVEQIVLDLAPLSRLAGHLDTWFSVTPDGSIITDRWLNASEIYAVSYSQR